MRKPAKERARAGEERSRRKPMGAWNAVAPENIAMHPTRTLRCTIFVCSVYSRRWKGRFKCTFGARPRMLIAFQTTRTCRFPAF